MSCVIGTLRQDGGARVFSEQLSLRRRGWRTPVIARGSILPGTARVNKAFYYWSRACCKKLYTIRDPNPSMHSVTIPL